MSRENDSLPVATRDGLRAELVETGGRRVSRRLLEHPSRHATGQKAAGIGLFKWLNVGVDLFYYSFIVLIIIVIIIIIVKTLRFGRIDYEPGILSYRLRIIE